MDFKTATDELVRETTLTLGDIAREFGVALGSLSRMRSGTSETNRLKPPEGWPVRLAALARAEGSRLAERSVQLEQLAADLDAVGDA